MQKIEIILEDNRKMTAELYEDLAPISVKNFIELVKKQHFDGLIFHRVIKGFMIQGGGMQTNMTERKSKKEIKGEFANNGWDKNLSLTHEPGVLSMARTNMPNSASSQFFIVTGDAKFLDGQYASFGKLLDKQSLDIAMELENVETHSAGMHSDVPKDCIVIKTIKLV